MIQQFSKADLDAVEAYMQKSIIKKNYTRGQLHKLYYKMLAHQLQVTRVNNFLLQSRLTRGVVSGHEYDFKRLTNDLEIRFAKCQLLRKRKI